VTAQAETYVQGVSTRKVKTITEELCGHAFSASPISAINKRLDVADVGSAFYDITPTPPPGITAVVSGGQLSVCADSQTTAPLGTFVIGFRAMAAPAEAFTRPVLPDVVPVPACQPSACVPNSCHGTVSDGCSGTLGCPNSCTSDLVYKSGLTCCAPTQIVNGFGQCACAQGMIWNPGVGPAGAC
jgi:hypothetical protein